MQKFATASLVALLVLGSVGAALAMIHPTAAGSQLSPGPPKGSTVTGLTNSTGSLLTQAPGSGHHTEQNDDGFRLPGWPDS